MNSDEVPGVVFPTGLILMAATPIIWAYQIFHWLRWGQWQSITIADGLKWVGAREPQFAWAGVQKVSDFIMSGPLSIMPFVIGLTLMVAYAELGERYDKAKRSKTDAQS